MFVCVCVCVCVWWRLAVFVYLKHVGAKKLLTHYKWAAALSSNPPFHAHVNFIITDTCIRRACLCTRTYSSTCTRTPLCPKKPATVEERLHQRQLSLISLYLRHLFLAFSFSPLSLHTFSFFLLLLIPSCFSPLCFPTRSLSHLCLSLCSTCLPGRCSSKEKWCFFVFFIYLFFLFSSRISEVHVFLLFFFLFFFSGGGKCCLKGSISPVLLRPPTWGKKKKAMPTLTPPPPPNPSDSSQPASPTTASFLIN